MGAEVFDSGDSPYFSWMHANAEGFVANTERTEGSSLLMVHRVGCPHIRRHNNKVDLAHNPQAMVHKERRHKQVAIHLKIRVIQVHSIHNHRVHRINV